MIRATTTILLLSVLVVGCADGPSGSPVTWHEGEAYTDGPRNETEGVGPKACASQEKALYGAVLGTAGGFARYQLKLDREIPDARLLIRYARYHWREMEPGQVSVTLLSDQKVIRADVAFADTGGWGNLNSEEWSIAAVDVGTMPAGTWIIKFLADKGPSDVNIDGFFLVPGGLNISAEEMTVADRIHIDSDRFVGIGVPSQVIFQQQFDRFDLPVRTFTPMELSVKVSVIDESQAERAVLIDVPVVPLASETRLVLVSAEPMQSLPDGAYTLRTQWEGAPALNLPVNLAGQLAATFEPRLAKVDQFAQQIRTSATDKQAAYVADFEHAVEFLADAWKKVLDGTADKPLLANIRRTLAQHEMTIEMLSKDHAPYARRCGDLRLAFRSEATGRLEQYRLFIPESYAPDGKTPTILVLNHHENAFLDQADDVVKKIANERGYVLISPGPVGTDGATAEYTGDGAKDLAQLMRLVLTNYPGIDRTRLYATGTSRGGFGTYSFATAHPNLFAAIACSSGTGNWRRLASSQRELIEKFVPVPTLILHGEIDSLVPVEGAKRVAKELAKRDIPHELHVFPSYGHSYRNYAAQYFTMSLDFFAKYVKEAPAPLP